MILTQKELKINIEISEEKINVWVIESKQILNNYALELINQYKGYEGDFIISKQNDILKFKDHVNVISDYFNIDFNSKKIQNRILKILIKYAEEDFLPNTLTIKSHLQSYIEELVDMADVDADYDEIIDIGEVLKLFDIRIKNSQESLLKTIIDYLKLNLQLFNEQWFIFINLSLYMDEDEMNELFKFILYEKATVLFIENNMEEQFKDKNCIILDPDYCII